VTRLWKPWDGDERRRFKGMVGSWGLEPQTSTVSRWRSNQLSYEPTLRFVQTIMQQRDATFNVGSKWVQQKPLACDRTQLINHILPMLCGEVRVFAGHLQRSVTNPLRD
jgi:hypothetical protein